MQKPETRLAVTSPPLRYLFAAASFVCVVISGLSAWHISSRAAGIDFFHYWSVPSALDKHAVDDIYSDEGKKLLAEIMYREALLDSTPDRQKAATVGTLRINNSRIDTVATPFLFHVFDVLSSGNYEHDHRCFEIVSFTLFILAVTCLCRLFRYSRGMTLVLLSVLMYPFDPFRYDASVGNVNRIQVAVFTAIVLLLSAPYSLKWRAKWPASGALLGILVAFKPNLYLAPIPLIAWCIMSGQVSRAAAFTGGIIAGAGTAFLLPAITFGDLSCWSQWTDVLPDILKSTRTLQEGNFGPASLIFHFTNIDTAMLLTAVMFLLAVALAWLCRKAGERVVPALLVVGPPLMLLSSRLAWTHYYTLAVPLFLYVMRPTDISRAGVRKFCFLVPLAAFSIVPSKLLSWPSQTRAAIMNISLLVFLAFAIQEIARGKDASSDQ